MNRSIVAGAVVAIAIKLDSRGPVLYRHRRVGHRWQPIDILKFRTMQVNAEAAGLQITVGQDPRITRAGSWLRRSKLDELPQLLNVLRGEMSMVGPRPEVPRYVALYPTDVREAVLSVRPGITDLASLAFRDESTLLAQSPDPPFVQAVSGQGRFVRSSEVYQLQALVPGTVSATSS